MEGGESGSILAGEVVIGNEMAGIKRDHLDCRLYVSLHPTIWRQSSSEVSKAVACRNVRVTEI